LAEEFNFEIANGSGLAALPVAVRPAPNAVHL
jgi:hypothetical protein